MNSKSVKELEANPFADEQISGAYKDVDPVYEASAREALNFVNPKDMNPGEITVLDIGAGTGVASFLLSEAGVKDLHVLDPSHSMIEIAEQKLGDRAKYIEASAEDMLEKLGTRFDLAYALNCFHLFRDLSSALANIACCLKTGGTFVMNITAPTYGFDDVTELEEKAVVANLTFYKKLLEKVENPILKHTVDLLEKILEKDYELIYSKEKIKQIFGSVNLELTEDSEAVIKVTPDYQKHIWKMMSRGFVQDEAAVDEIISAIELPEEVHIRQAIFKFINKNEDS